MKHWLAPCSRTDDEGESNNWIGTTHCKGRHHANLDLPLGSNEKGGDDGREMKGYDVIDKKRTRSGRGAKTDTIKLAIAPSKNEADGLDLTFDAHLSIILTQEFFCS